MFWCAFLNFYIFNDITSEKFCSQKKESIQCYYHRLRNKTMNRLVFTSWIDSVLEGKIEQKLLVTIICLSFCSKGFGNKMCTRNYENNITIIDCTTYVEWIDIGTFMSLIVSNISNNKLKIISLVQLRKDLKEKSQYKNLHALSLTTYPQSNLRCLMLSLDHFFFQNPFT